MNFCITIKYILLLFLLFFNWISFAQNQITGTVFDKNTGETLIGAAVVESNTKKGVTTNQYGHFFLNVSGSDSIVELVVSYLGYKRLEVSVIKSLEINLWLEAKPFSIEEVVVRENAGLDNRLEIGHFKMNSKELNHLPSFSGETDLTTFMQLVPGVAIAGDGDASMNVRGGGSDQNLFLLDDMPLYYVNHLGGFLSTFNADIIKSTDLYKSGFPSRYGGRLSSVVDVRTNDGNLNEFDIYGTVGLISSKLGIEGPIVKNKSSFLLSFRKNTIPFFRWMYDLNVDYNFYDTNVKFNYILSPKDRIFFSFYNGNDKVSTRNNVEENKNDQSISWGNIAGSVRYSRVLSSNLYANLIIGNTTYGYKEWTAIEEHTEANGVNIHNNKFSSSINDNFLNINFEYYPLEKLNLNLGYGFINHNFIPGESTFIQSGPGITNVKQEYGYPQSSAQEHNSYLQADIADFYKLNIQAGMRSTLLFANRENYFLPEPRISLFRKIGKKLQFKAAFDVMHQNFHLLTNQGSGIPVEYRIPVLSFAPPEKSVMYSAGVSYFPGLENIQIDIDFYKKQLHNLVTLKEGVNFSSSFNSWENIIWNDGSGTSNGLEILVRKKTGKTTGWVGSTIAKTERKFKEINNGNPYPYKYDRPFEFKSFFSHQLNERISFSATWVYGAGTPITVPVGQYYDLEGDVILLYGDKNSVRGNPYHRLDIGFAYKLYPKWGESEWNLSVINIYNRKNPYYYFTDYDIGFTGTGKMTLYEQSLFPFLPSVSYSFKF